MATDDEARALGVPVVSDYPNGYPLIPWTPGAFDPGNGLADYGLFQVTMAEAERAGYKSRFLVPRRDGPPPGMFVVEVA